jgi:hypothetical protein
VRADAYADERVAIAIADTGMGIAPEHCGHISTFTLTIRSLRPAGLAPVPSVDRAQPIAARKHEPHEASPRRLASHR